MKTNEMSCSMQTWYSNTQVISVTLDNCFKVSGPCVQTFCIEKDSHMEVFNM